MGFDSGTMRYSDAFKDPPDIGNWIDPDIEIPFGRPYDYGHLWESYSAIGSGIITVRIE